MNTKSRLTSSSSSWRGSARY